MFSATEFSPDLCFWKWKNATKETKRLKQELEEAYHSNEALKVKLQRARRLLNTEKKNHQKTEEKFNDLAIKWNMLRQVLLNNGNHSHSDDELRDIISKLQERCSEINDTLFQRDSVEHWLKTAPENLNHEGTLTYMTEDDFDTSSFHKKWKTLRPSMPGEDLAITKQRSSNVCNKSMKKEERREKIKKRLHAKRNQISQYTDPSMQQPTVPGFNSCKGDTEEPRHYMLQNNRDCIIRSISSLALPGIFSREVVMKQRTHVFCQKTIIRPETCEPCGKKIKFGKLAMKCQECHACTHLECKDHLPLPCVPVTATSIRKGIISDFTPLVSPMIPALILHCIIEIEQRGLKELNLYMIPALERDVKSLKEKFMRGRGAPNLSDVNVHVLCGTIKTFLHSLNEPLLTYALWSNFTKCLSTSKLAESKFLLYKAVSKLPQPNRDTLACMILHLKRVSESPECKVTILRLAKIFGPLLMGHSSSTLQTINIIEETEAIKVVELMLRTESSYWSTLVTDPNCEHY